VRITIEWPGPICFAVGRSVGWQACPAARLMERLENCRRVRSLVNVFCSGWVDLMQLERVFREPYIVH
jgi:hypothetical protein